LDWNDVLVHHTLAGFAKTGWFVPVKERLSAPKSREIPFDAGHFGQIPDIFPEVGQLRRLRKHMERSNNLFKHRAGLERLRIKSQHAVQATATLAQLAIVFATLAAPHRPVGKEKGPKQLPLAA